MAKVLAYALVLLIVQNSIGTVDARKLEQTVFTAEDLYEMFGPNGCLEGIQALSRLVFLTERPTTNRIIHYYPSSVIKNVFALR